MLRYHVLYHVEQLALAGRFQFCFQFVSCIEMVFDGALVTAGYEDHFRDACGYRLFDRILDQRFVNDRQHFFRLRLGGWQKTAAETSNGENCFSDFFHGSSQ